MNSDKLTNYNQKMKAVSLTILVAIAAIALIAIIIAVIPDGPPPERSDTNNLLSDIIVDDLKKDSLRQQIISYESPILIDTSNQIYLIPVKIRTLQAPEKYKRNKSADSEPTSRLMRTNQYAPPVKKIDGSFLNLLVYDYKNNTTKKISDKRMLGSGLIIKEFGNQTFVLFRAAEFDSDSDGKITSSDFQSFFIYSLKNKKLTEIKRKNSTVISFKFVESEKGILIEFGCDRNNNNIYEKETEPKHLMKYDFVKDSAYSLVNEELDQELQDIIDKN